MKRTSYQRRKRKLLLYIAFLLVMALSIVFMPIGTAQKEKSMIPMIIIGALFWIGLIGTIATAVHINTSRRRSAAFQESHPYIRQFGLICFFRNIPAIIADMAFFLSGILLIATMLIFKIQILQFIAIGSTVFTFAMHCMLNGVNYIYLKHE